MLPKNATSMSTAGAPVTRKVGGLVGPRVRTEMPVARKLPAESPDVAVAGGDGFVESCTPTSLAGTAEGWPRAAAYGGETQIASADSICAATKRDLHVLTLTALPLLESFATSAREPAATPRVG